jgi:acyl-[acyl-carrier-protein]-phospholipid O-acyltransferase/long-chain-fatty-acid--[acyl-carrier-protein] ligase
MVPHETIEQQIIAALTTEEHSERFLAVMGVADPVKGEALVMLSTIDVDLPALRAKLASSGVPNLWIPKTVRRVEAIPVLASGKLDLAGCKKLAEQEG